MFESLVNRRWRRCGNSVEYGGRYFDVKLGTILWGYLFTVSHNSPPGTSNVRSLG
jgi:hypothetical protein